MEHERYRGWARQHKKDHVLEYQRTGPSAGHYLFYRPVEEGDDEFPLICTEILKELLAPYYVAALVEDWKWELETGRKNPNKPTPPPFPLRYYERLKAQGIAENAFCDGEKALITVTRGLDLPLVNGLLGRKDMEIWSNSIRFYGCRDGSGPYSSFQEAREALDRDSYDLFAAYEECFDKLEMVARGGGPDWRSVLRATRAACAAHDRPLVFMKEKPYPAEEAYELYQGRFYPDIGNMDMQGYTFSPLGSGYDPPVIAGLYHMAEAAFRALLAPCPSARLEVSTTMPMGPEKEGSPLRMNRDFPRSYAMLLESHGLYPGQFQFTEGVGRQELVLDFPGGDPGPLAACFSQLRCWPELGFGFRMVCSGALGGEGEPDFEHPDLRLLCSDCHPAITIEVSGRIREEELACLLERVCRENGKGFLCNFPG